MSKSYSVRYRFSQRFDAPPKKAYEWCTDYRTDDWTIMGKNGKRKIERLNEDTIILTDTYAGKNGPVTKQRLVRLSPESLAWTNTHVGGPNLHSQFWYQIVPEGKGSRLDFTGLQVNYGRRPSVKKVAKLSEELAKEDSGMWLLLAEAMHKDFF